MIYLTPVRVAHHLTSITPCRARRWGFVAQRHDNVRDLLTKLLCNVCHNVQAEPQHIPLNDEQFNVKSTTTSQDARLDIKARGFCQRGVTVEPRFNEVAGDRPNLFVKSRVRYIENLDITNLSGNHQNVRYIEVIVND